MCKNEIPKKSVSAYRCGCSPALPHTKSRLRIGNKKAQKIDCLQFETKKITIAYNLKPKQPNNKKFVTEQQK